MENFQSEIMKCFEFGTLFQPAMPLSDTVNPVKTK